MFDSVSYDNIPSFQELYGMNGKSNYRKQAERNLERAVCNGQMSISDYYTRKMEIQHSSIAGIDDGHSCTRGVSHAQNSQG